MSNEQSNQRQLPALADLHHAPEEAFKQDQLNLLLNQQPPEKWIKTNPYAGNTQYIPIEKVEFLLTRIFQQWKLEVIGYSQLFNSVACHVRLHYKNPLTGEWLFQDGLGAVGIQTDKGAAASDLNSIKQAAVMMALPAAESYALKDAAEKLGELFGKNLNRKDTQAFTGAYMSSVKKEVIPVPEELKIVISLSEADKLTELYKANPEYHNNPEFMQLLNQRRQDLKSVAA